MLPAQVVAGRDKYDVLVHFRLAHLRWWSITASQNEPGDEQVAARSVEPCRSDLASQAEVCAIGEDAKHRQPFGRRW